MKYPDQPIAVKVLVKNPPFKESTDNGLIIFIQGTFVTLNGQHLDMYGLLDVSIGDLLCHVIDL